MFGRLLLKEFKLKIPLFITSGLAFWFIYWIFGYSYSRLEVIYVFFALILCSFIVGNEEETDYIKMSCYKLENVVITRFIVIYIGVALLPSFEIMMFAKERNSVKTLIMFLTMNLFASALGTFWRMILRKTFAAFIFSSLSMSFILFFTAFDNKIVILLNVFFSSMLFEENMFYTNRAIVILYSVLLLGTAYLKIKRISSGTYDNN